MLLLQLPTILRRTLEMLQTLPALQFSLDVFPVYHALVKQMLLPHAPAKWPLFPEPFRWDRCYYHLCLSLLVKINVALAKRLPAFRHHGHLFSPWHLTLSS
jgi:hypothetical protein